ncbi:glycosyltransferase family 2 protein [Chthonobacter rhizosphaerae]|uniref:glycosyltransferase family 2 protein n=1 Tax=Chthonobacter rhizosphaerae TaxID=2735553 RepID=UPI0015EF918F|nr:glycosyltransferase [Chthonobacter rhizosphaerae]
MVTALCEAAPSPLVSVVMPAYNASGLIKASIHSILAQSFTNFEVIIVDDGSTDDTLEIAHSYAAADPRVRVVSQQNAGVASARNHGIRIATGRYIAPIDADDLWHRERLARHIEALEAAGESAVVVYSPFYIVDEEGLVISASHDYHMTGCVLFRHLFYNAVGNGSGMTFRRNAVTWDAPYEPSLRARGAQGCEDFLIQLKLALNGEYVHVPEYLIGYRRHPENMSANIVAMKRSRVLALAEIRPYIAWPWRWAVDWSMLKEVGILLRFGLKRDGLAFLIQRPEPLVSTIGTAAALLLCLPHAVLLRIERVLQSRQRIPKGTPGQPFEGASAPVESPSVPRVFVSPGYHLLKLMDRRIGYRAVAAFDKNHVPHTDRTTTSQQ